MKVVYITKFSDCTSSKLVHEKLINVINNQLQNNFVINVLDLYNPEDCLTADKLGVFDAPCITCENEHLQGLVEENTIYNFLNKFIEL